MKDKQPIKSKLSFFPRIFRFITEEWKLILTSFASGLILIAIVIQGLGLYQNIKEQQKTKIEREKLIKELSYWKSTASQYKNYRDVYFKIAALEYELGNIEESKIYVKKVLDIDPSFEQAKTLKAQVGL